MSFVIPFLVGLAIGFMLNSALIQIISEQRRHGQK
jgi:hypothetical protein